jgi:hypothetical protein
LLDDSDIWTKNYFDPNNAKKHRREMFFANPENAWSGKAPSDDDVFVGEGTRAPRAAAGKKRQMVRRATAKPGRKRATKSARLRKRPKKGAAKKTHPRTTARKFEKRAAKLRRS